MKNNCIFLLCVFNFMLSFSQDKHFSDSVENKYSSFVITINNKLIPAKSIKYENPIFKDAFLQVDMVQFSPDQVKFYKNYSGLYANMRKVNFSGVSQFAKRETKGKVNVFEYSKSGASYGYNPTTGGTMYMGTTKSTKYYYNKGFNELKKLNYQNLKVDFSDNAESMIFVEQFNKMKNTQIALTISGSAIVIGTLIAFANADPEVDNEGNETYGPPNFVGLGLGSVCLGASYFVSLSKIKFRKKAIKKYNE